MMKKNAKSELQKRAYRERDLVEEERMRREREKRGWRRRESAICLDRFDSIQKRRENGETTKLRLFSGQLLCLSRIQFWTREPSQGWWVFDHSILCIRTCTLNPCQPPSAAVFSTLVILFYNLWIILLNYQINKQHFRFFFLTYKAKFINKFACIKVFIESNLISLFGHV